MFVTLLSLVSGTRPAPRTKALVASCVLGRRPWSILSSAIRPRPAPPRHLPAGRPSCLLWPGRGRTGYLQAVGTVKPRPAAELPNRLCAITSRRRQSAAVRTAAISARTPHPTRSTGVLGCCSVLIISALHVCLHLNAKGWNKSGVRQLKVMVVDHTEQAGGWSSWSRCGRGWRSPAGSGLRKRQTMGPRSSEANCCSLKSVTAVRLWRALLYSAHKVRHRGGHAEDVGSDPWPCDCSHFVTSFLGLRLSGVLP